MGDTRANGRGKSAKEKDVPGLIGK